MKAEQTRCPQEAGPVSDGVPRAATDPRSHRGNARSSDRLGRRLGGQSIPTRPRRWPGTQHCPVAGRAGRLTVRIVGGSTSPADPGSALSMTVERYAFHECEATTAAGVLLRIPAGVHRPRYLNNGSEMQLSDFASASNRRHKHHVFPRQHLRQQSGLSQRAMNSILNLCLIPAEENCHFGARPPRKYFEPFRETSHFPQVMSRHLLPAGADEGLWDQNSGKGYLRFLRAREVLVCTEFERAAGVKLFRRKAG